MFNVPAGQNTCPNIVSGVFSTVPGTYPGASLVVDLEGVSPSTGYGVVIVHGYRDDITGQLSSVVEYTISDATTLPGTPYELVNRLPGQDPSFAHVHLLNVATGQRSSNWVGGEWLS